MKPNLDSSYVNGFYITGNKKHQPPLWKWKGLKLTTNTEQNLSISNFLHDNVPKLEESVLGPGAGAGVGCGVGVGLGLVGGIGQSGSTWNHVRLVFGFGMGCGVGAGFGYGQGFGVGSSWKNLRSRILKPNPDSRKQLVIQL